MLVFLIITSSSLAFYVVLLVALHRDGQKRRAGAGPLRKISLGTVAELSTARAISTAAIAARRSNSAALLVRFGETRRHEKGKSQAVVSELGEVITLPKFVKDDLQCG